MFKNVQKMLKDWEKEYKKGFTSYLILVLLKDSSMYGYQIKSRLEEVTNGVASFQESGIYQLLKKMSRNGFLTSAMKQSDKGPVRKYYTITKAGQQLINLFTTDFVIPINSALSDFLAKSFSELN